VTDDEKMELVERHIDAEMRGDLDAIMTTMTDHPIIDGYPGGLRFEGAEAVRAMYASQKTGNGRYSMHNLKLWVNEHGVIREDIATMNLSGGGQFSFPMVSIFIFEGDRISQERAYRSFDYSQFL
jgi:hypothetical protein